MKTKTEAKRRQILDIAAEVFREAGFERASMSQICSRVGGSKATLYNYFPSKEELFLEVMLEGTRGQFEEAMAELGSQAHSVREALQRFGEKLLPLIFSPEVLASRRLMIAEAIRSDIGRACYDKSRGKGEALIAAYLQQAATAGRLRPLVATVAASQLLGLLEAELHSRLFEQNPQPLQPQQVAEITTRALDVFMAAYGV